MNYRADSLLKIDKNDLVLMEGIKMFSTEYIVQFSQFCDYVVSNNNNNKIHLHRITVFTKTQLCP